MRDDHSRPLLLHTLCHANKHRYQLMCFSLERLKSSWRNNFCFRKKFYPIKRFVELLQCTFDFADEVCVRFCPTGFSILRAY